VELGRDSSSLTSEHDGEQSNIKERKLFERNPFMQAVKHVCMI